MLLETEYLNQEHLNGFDKYKVSFNKNPFHLSYFTNCFPEAKKLS